MQMKMPFYSTRVCSVREAEPVDNIAATEFYPTPQVGVR